MAVTFDPGTDFEDVVDGLEPVTLLRRGNDTTALAHALRRELRVSEVAISDGRYRQGDVRWHFPDVEAVTTPRLGDRILDTDGRYWTVLDIAHATLRHRFACVTRDVDVYYGLDDTISVWRAEWAKGAAGAMEPEWKVYRTGIRARIQEIRADADTDHEARVTAKRYEIYVAEDLDVGHGHRIKDREGTIYKVLDTTGKADIGELQIISAEVVPWPFS